MIDHYHFRQDGLLCKLRKVVAAPDFIRTKQDSASISSESPQGSPSSLKKPESTMNVSRTASHSLPSLASLNVTSPTVATSNDTNRGSPVIRKVNEDVMHSSTDLISFNDWPNVTSLLANQNANNSASAKALHTNGSAIGRKVSGQGSKFARPILPPLQSIPFGCGDALVHTPFTPINPDATPTPKAGGTIQSPTSPFSRAKLKAPLIAIATTPTASSDESLQQARPLQTSATCPLIPDVGNNATTTSAAAATTTTVANSFSAVFRTNNFASGATQRTASATRNPQLPPCKFSPNNSLPPESLNFPPIIDALWEEPDGSEERSQPSSSMASINLESLPPPPPHILNPFLPLTTSAVSPQPCHHAPGVSTFCNSTCCQRKESQPNSPQLRDTTPPASVLPAIEEAQKIYDSLPDNTLFLPPESLSLMERLGGGNFGQVVKGIYKTPHGLDVQVAVKTLKESQIACTGEQTILAEAKTMTQLKHRHIVRLIGVCKAQRFMLVLELAPLGPINKYLKKHPDTSVCVLAELMHQVAQGMAYLESCKLVHRDLAARNVLLVTQRFAKISDFGMSKALNFGNDYYRAASAGKWPLKWYAPECIYYFRFDSKSDVWSYGITLWEVFSYGERPYKDMKGAQILAMLDQGLRLSRPARCPEPIYAVMQQCWNAEGVRRPTFTELVLTMSRLAAGPLLLTPLPGGLDNERAVANSGGSGVNSGGGSASAFAFF
ncbi:unnamed protein product [Mesocestoides corti]|uniref:Protein kinase domain-containing protein n=2 Tax=Mesocestoides corti TaxID=53468 RepID=A0A158QUA3_MESCO|nr:unnamed protein product [Mesocestoides corti]